MPHLGVISIWKLLCTMFTSSLRFEGVMKTLWSILSFKTKYQNGSTPDKHSVYTFSAPAPNNCRNVALIRVFLPAPLGP